MAEERCGTCRFWELSLWGANNQIESGVGGHHCDGSVSNCRRNAPVECEAGMKLHGDAKWPTTKHNTWCGQWEPRPTTEGDPA